MRILGIDPGSKTTGYGVIDNNKDKLSLVVYGTTKSRKADPFPERLKIVFDGLNRVIEDYKPDHIALENVFYGKSVKSAIKIGEARGVAILCSAIAKIPMFEYAPTVVKRAVVGYGNAQKAQVSEMVKIILALSETPKDLDATDALAIAICHCHRIKLNV